MAGAKTDSKPPAKGQAYSSYIIINEQQAQKTKRCKKKSEALKKEEIKTTLKVHSP